MGPLVCILVVPYFILYFDALFWCNHVQQVDAFWIGLSIIYQSDIPAKTLLSSLCFAASANCFKSSHLRKSSQGLVPTDRSILAELQLCHYWLCWPCWCIHNMVRFLILIWTHVKTLSLRFLVSKVLCFLRSEC